MCLYPRKLKNRKYTATDKNQGIIPDPPIVGYNDLGLPIYDQRVLEIEVPCGQCIECREQKAREWQVRLAEEIKDHKYNYFITLTFAPKELEKIAKKLDLTSTDVNAAAGYAVRHMLERWRKTHKKSIKHWLITELGHEGTERIHLHGLLFSDEVLEFGDLDSNNLRRWQYWKYGQIYVGEYVNQKTINYISKYITKIDNDHKGFVGQILASPGIGKQYVEKIQQIGSDIHNYRPRNTNDFYRLPNGCKVKLPKYYKNKFINEEDRETMWREFMDRETLSVLGQEHSTRTTTDSQRSRLIDNARNYSKQMGYGDDSGEWKKKEWNITRRMLQKVELNKRIEEMRSKMMAKIKNGDDIDGKITDFLQKYDKKFAYIKK